MLAFVVGAPIPGADDLTKDMAKVGEAGVALPGGVVSAVRGWFG